MKKLSGIACKHPQYYYSGMHKSLQQEWAFVQPVTPNLEDKFGPVEQAMR